MTRLDKEQEHRERVLRYQHKNAATIRIKRRNEYRIKHGIPLNRTVAKRRPVEYV